MYIMTDDYFVPKQFIVYTFYGKKTCFCWDENKLAIFPYKNDHFTAVELVTAPGPIKSIQCFTDRVFLICIPQGVYKLSRDREFAILSMSAVGLGTVFYEVLTPRSKNLYLDNKQTMTNKLLFQLSSEDGDSSNLCICPLNLENAGERFMRSITNDSTAESLCLIADDKILFVLIRETVRIVHSSIYCIRDIVPVQRDSKIGGLLLITTADIILMYSRNDLLSFEKICLGIHVQSICAGFSQSSEDILWFVYSDESKLYYGKKQLLMKSVQQINVQEKSFACLKCYDSKTILGLTTNKQLDELSADVVERTLSVENDTFINLNADMLKGSQLEIDKIYRGTQELHSLNMVLLTEEETLSRINLYAHRRKARLVPKVSINRIADQLFLSVKLDTLPKNSWVVLNLRSECLNIFSMRKVVDEKTVVDICVPNEKAENFLGIAIDLITLKDESHSWCLIRNYITNPLLKKNKKKKTRSDQTNFINSKIAVLENFIRDGDIDMKMLSEMKRSVRRKFGDT
ncbi:uncharacterized protein LOC143374349 [Andrena cerasifolii]|uniref:uncharacterized protein LOC143374349 n=1 Tax=Andrena cerasifolii TaxID=2819439 RepID=UPI004037CFBC